MSCKLLFYSARIHVFSTAHLHQRGLPCSSHRLLIPSLVMLCLAYPAFLGWAPACLASVPPLVRSPRTPLLAQPCKLSSATAHPYPMPCYTSLLGPYTLAANSDSLLPSRSLHLLSSLSSSFLTISSSAASGSICFRLLYSSRSSHSFVLCCSSRLLVHMCRLTCAFGPVPLSLYSQVHFSPISLLYLCYISPTSMHAPFVLCLFPQLTYTSHVLGQHKWRAS